ncbi:alpha/beta fold hydrolase [Vampirovibrio chlorellavorus]|uniref:alpha/beta fold hydrolase n=1 Tax=Vampirovibrio chlorellavorus TaxID=758823 RepID=UPI0026E9509B|nr:alpha/beta fold hydrolase [Vampirovibrio chlorellavorus]
MFEVLSFTSSDGSPLKYGRLNHPEPPASGQALLFIPGLGGSVKGALHFLELLLPRYNPIFAPDLRGFGLNPVDIPLPQAPIIWQDLEAFHQQVLQPHTPDKMALCGISLGGVLSTLLATRHPQRFSSVTLLAPAYKPHQQTFSPAYVLRNVLSHLLLGARARTQLPYGLEAITRNPTILNDPQFNGALKMPLTPGFLLGVRDWCNQAMREIQTLQIPSLMVVPGQDIVCDPGAMRQAYERIPRHTPKQLLNYPDFYHDVLFEADYGRLAQGILDGLASLTSEVGSGSS